MQKSLLIGAGIVLLGVLVGVLATQSAISLWDGSIMSDEQQTTPMANTNQERDTGQPQGMGGMHGAMLITSERAFIESMVPHHEEAIATAEEVLERGGTTAGMVELANNIITSQTAEVALMKTNYLDWFGVPYADTGEYEPMMRELESYNGAELDRIFLHDMTMHHMGAIMMSRSVRPYLEHDTMRELTNNIITNQSREIELMRELFTQLE